MLTSDLHPHLARLIDENAATARQRWGDAAGYALRSVGVVGAGWMGVSIAAAMVKAGVGVTLADIQPAACQSAAARVQADLTAGRQMPGDEAAELVRRLRVTGDLAAAAACDLVLETVPEDPAVKQRVYAAVEPLLAPQAVLASNTSSIPIGRLAVTLARPDRFCGIHFCHPVRHRPLVEIVPGERTSPATVSAALGWVRSIGRLPLVAGDRPGFVVNRLLNPYLTGALELLLDGNRIDDVDRALTAFGMAMGPLRMLDEIGIDVALWGGRLLHEAYPGRVPPSPLLVALVKAGRLGRKAGAGFYAYPPGLDADRPGTADPKADDLVAYWTRAERPLPPESLVDRLLLPVVLEAVRILEEGEADGPGAIDLAMALGLGFPNARGGLLLWADAIGPRQLIERLRPWSALGEPMRPPALLEQMAEEGRPFFERNA